MNRSRRPHVTTLLTFDFEAEPEPTHVAPPPHHARLAGAGAALAVAAVLVLNAPNIGSSPPAAVPGVSTDVSTAVSCGAVIPCSPSGEVAARWARERDAARHEREHAGPRSRMPGTSDAVDPLGPDHAYRDAARVEVMVP